MNPRHFTILILFACLARAVFPDAAAADRGTPSLETILDNIESAYSGTGFSAHFDQTSTLKAIDITDTASGTLHAAHPGKMRWAYETPYPQLIITDGRTLWIYRPEDLQVMVGDAPEYFGDGKGASFLSDIRMIRENFNVRLFPDDPEQPYYRLKLDPKVQIPGLATVYIDVSKAGFTVMRVTTINPYGDETVIELSQLQRNQVFDDGFFHFEIPPGTDVLQLEN